MAKDARGDGKFNEPDDFRGMKPKNRNPRQEPPGDKLTKNKARTAKREFSRNFNSSERE